MFTGIVTGLVKVVEVSASDQDTHLLVDLGCHAEGIAIGASIALSGVCCTVAALDGTKASFVLSPETLRRTWFGDLRPGSALNVEPCLRAGDPMGGHVVQGHVDGVGTVVTPVPLAGGELWVRLPQDLLRYCVEKGSISLDGISLTIAGLEDDCIMVAIIPHTAEVTTLGTTPAGGKVNVEVDILAKYIERLLHPTDD
ncbi:MAG: riboflavin synthase [Planctomycetota bacterium]|jgi:riboflavin synthase